MNPIVEGQLEFTFEPQVLAEQVDAGGGRPAGWPQQNGNHSKIVDIVANEASPQASIVWLIEVKDFRTITAEPNKKNNAGLADTVTSKVRDSLAGLNALAVAGPDPAFRAHAAAAVAARHTRVVLHLEPNPAPSKLSFMLVTPAHVQAKLRQLLKPIDPHPLVLSITTTPRARVPWQVR